jgi:hypothetical protein
MPLHNLAHNLDPATVILGGMLALLSLAIATKLYRCARTRFPKK